MANEIVDAWVVGAHVIPQEIVEASGASLNTAVGGDVLVMHRGSETFEVLDADEFDAEYEWTTEETE